MHQYQIDNLIAAITSGTVVLLTAWAFLSVLRRRMADRHELRRGLLEKLTTEETLRLVQSAEGRQWLHEVLVGADDRRSAIERGMTILFASIGCGLAGWAMHAKPLGILGIVGLTTALGQLLAVFWLSRRGD